MAQQLREMEVDSLVHREVFPGAVQRVEYSVTEFGKSLNSAVIVLSKWGKDHEARLALKEEGCSQAAAGSSVGA
ncbi:hypothetical protein BIWAKO_06507 [Bosea sp. BIWAKO-01]|nr:hypothetical protein BIWAKO_06507 [Bosea sp. BIWAKO-01]